MPRLSVIVPNWNGRAFLPECLETLHRQDFQDFEVLVVDNGSSDGSVEFVERQYPWTTVIPLEQNRGFSAAANAGIAACRGEYVVLVNNDTRTDPVWLSSLVEAMDRTKNASFGASKILFHDPPHLIDAAGDGFSIRRGHGTNLGRGEPRDRFQDVAWVPSACAAAAIYRKALFDDVGLFDEDFFLVFEDIDFGLRAQLGGHRCLYIPDAIVYHKGGASTDRRTPEYSARFVRNMIWAAGKNLPAALLVPWAFIFAFKSAVAACKRLVRHIVPLASKSREAVISRVSETAELDLAAIRRVYWPVLLDGLRRLPEKRRKTQAKRRVSSLYMAGVLLRPRRPLA